LDLPAPGALVLPGTAYAPLLITGLQVHPENPLLFDFILDTGVDALPADSPAFRAEAQKCVRYFLTALTVREDDLWVNLSPNERERVMVPALAQTGMGRDMLAQDYMLKQLTASLMYPDKDLGRAFWDKVYAKVRAQFGTVDIPVDTFNKVWITSDKAQLYERGQRVLVTAAHLKVLLEGDPAAASALPEGAVVPMAPDAPGAVLARQAVRAVILPAIEDEVNHGRTFAPLRQMFYAMIMATWYRSALKEALLNRVYSNRAKLDGVLSNDPGAQERIYAQYMQSFRQGVVDMVKEEEDAASGGVVPRRYFAGGIAPNLDLAKNITIGKDMAMASTVPGALLVATVEMVAARKLHQAYDRAVAMPGKAVYWMLNGVSSVLDRFLPVGQNMAQGIQLNLMPVAGMTGVPVAATPVQQAVGNFTASHGDRLARAPSTYSETQAVWNKLTPFQKINILKYMDANKVKDLFLFYDQYHPQTGEQILRGLDRNGFERIDLLSVAVSHGALLIGAPFFNVLEGREMTLNEFDRMRGYMAERISRLPRSGETEKFMALLRSFPVKESRDAILAVLPWLVAQEESAGLVGAGITTDAVELAEPGMKGGIALSSPAMDITRDGGGAAVAFDPAMAAEFERGDFTGLEGVILQVSPWPAVLPAAG
jgi:hypothetical protein